MSQTADLLIEFFGEEIPARMQVKASEDLKRLLLEQLAKAGLSCDKVESYVTPRRLAIAAYGVPKAQSDQTVEKRGPRIDAPEAAVQGFLKSVGLTNTAECDTKETAKGTFLLATQHIKGQQTKDVIPDFVNYIVQNLKWPKSMRWRSNTQSWVRPIHNILCIFDRDVVDGSVDLGDQKIAFTNTTWGHRFLAPEAITIRCPDDYVFDLERATVVAVHKSRKALIQHKIQQLAKGHKLAIHPDPTLLEEVTGLVEWPMTLIGTIDQKFMDLPQEVLITSMRVHQKYFALTTQDNKLAPYFILVSNIKPEDGGAMVVTGNERVLRARLADAQFFFDQDRKISLEQHLQRLAKVIFHAKLGSLGQKAIRLEKLAAYLAIPTQANVQQAQRAAKLCKADLVTEMVGEFPELQGTMGSYYAQHDGEPTEVAQAIAEHYRPRGPNEDLPSTLVGDVVSLADKIDTLVGFFAVGIKPTGAKDPYALRRVALGVIRLAERYQQLDLFDALSTAYDLYVDADNNLPDLLAKTQVMADLRHFILDRLKIYWRDQGQRHDHIAAVFAVAGDTPLALLHQRVQALQDLMKRDDSVGTDLLTAYKRACNIVRIEEGKDQASYNSAVQPKLLVEEAEKKLHQSLTQQQKKIQVSLNQHNYADAMAQLAALKPDIDGFFDDVLVNAKDLELRANRLRMLSLIRNTFDQITDFKEIEG